MKGGMKGRAGPQAAGRGRRGPGHGGGNRVGGTRPVEAPAAPGGAPVAPGDRIELTLHGLAAEGDAVGRYRGMAVFVPLGAPGDRVRARAVEVKPRYARATLEEVLEPGPGRTGPACPLFGRCGGCHLQHLTYEAQLAWKRQQVIDALTRIGKLEEPVVLPTLGMERPWYYRNKAAVPVRRRPGGRVELGFFARGTHELVDFGPGGCAIQHPVITRVLAAVREWLEETPDGLATPVYDEATHTGLLRHVVVRVGLKTGEALAGLVINGDALPGEEGLAAFLRQRVPQLVGVVKNINRRRGNVILGDETVPIAGRPWLVDELGGLRFRVSLASFYQVNPVQAERLYQRALDEALGGVDEGSHGDGARPRAAGPAGQGAGPWIIDAYAGIGTLALLAAARLGFGRRGAGAARLGPGPAGTTGTGGAGARGRVTAIEVVPEATADAEANAAFNGIEGVEFITGRVEEVLPALAREAAGGGRRPDVILLDPPRKGCEPAALAACLELAPPRIVYVSCNPATLARDLAVLCDTGSAAAPRLKRTYPAGSAGASPGVAAGMEGTGPGATPGYGHETATGTGRRPRPRYRLVRAQPVDMFPQTAHVECVALLERVAP